MLIVTLARISGIRLESVNKRNALRRRDRFEKRSARLAVTSVENAAARAADSGRTARLIAKAAATATSAPLPCSNAMVKSSGASTGCAGGRGGAASRRRPPVRSQTPANRLDR